MQRGEIEGRVDANIHHPDRIKIIHQLKKINWVLKPLKLVAKFHKNVCFQNLENLPYVGLENIENNTGFFIETSEKENFSSAVKFQKGQVLFPKLRPYLNKIYLAEFSGLCSTEFHILDSDIVDNRYLAHFLRLNLVVNQTKHLMSGNTLPRLQTLDIQNLLIPVPPLEIQAQIVAQFETAYAQKRAKEAEAKTLLAGIDEYLLNALGIRLPEPTEKKKFFYVRANQVSGGRLDAFYHQSEFEELEKALRNGHYELINFKELIIDLKNGIEIRNYVESGFRYLRVTDLDKHSINDTNKRFVDVAEIPDKIKLNKNCILVARSGSLGLISIVTDELLNSILSSHIFKIELNINLVKPEYLELYFRSILGQKQFFRKNNGGVIPEINQNALKSILVSLPPLAVQAEIANHITEIRTKAKRLEQEAKEIIERAKKEVEMMILNLGTTNGQG